MTHICVGNLTIIGSDNGLSPSRRQAITWTNIGILLIGPIGTNFSEMLIEIHTFSFNKIHLKMSSGKWRPFYLGLNVINRLKMDKPLASQWTNISILKSSFNVPVIYKSKLKWRINLTRPAITYTDLTFRNDYFSIPRNDRWLFISHIEPKRKKTNCCPKFGHGVHSRHVYSLTYATGICTPDIQSKTMILTIACIIAVGLGRYTEYSKTQTELCSFYMQLNSLAYLILLWWCV